MTLAEILAELKRTDEFLQSAQIDEKQKLQKQQLKALISELQSLISASSVDPLRKIASPEYSQLPIFRHELQQLAIHEKNKRALLIEKILGLCRQVLTTVSALPGTEDYPDQEDHAEG